MPAPLDSIAAALRAGVPLDEDDIERAATAIESFARGEVARAEPGQRHPRTQAALAERDRLLCEAAETYFGNLTDNGRAAALHGALDRFATTAWLRERVLDECPARHLGTVREACWRALKLHEHVLSARAIRRKLATSSGYSWPTRPVTVLPTQSTEDLPW